MKKWIKLFLNWKFLLTYGIAFLILHGWSIVFVILGPILKIDWMIISGSTWLGILLMPNGVGIFTTLLLAIPLQMWWFKNDKQLKEDLENLKKNGKDKRI